MSNNLQDIFIGRQPILDREQQIVAYELLFRNGGSNDANVHDDMSASAHVIIHAFGESSESGESGINDVIGDKKAFINVSADLLLSDMIELLPRDKVVIELLETIQVTEQIIARCQQLKTMGFTLALDDFNGGAEFESLYDLVEIIKLDLTQIPQQDLAKHVMHLRKWPLQLLAEKVESTEQAKHCMDLGFNLFQGYYYARPVILSGKRADSSKLALLKLIDLVLADADVTEIEQVFKHDSSLSFNLLRMINSAAMGMRHKVASLRQAIVVLGQQQLHRWLQLLLFVSPGSELNSNPLLELAATRGKLMELLAVIQAPQDKEFQERAFMVGIMSLLETMLGIAIKDIVSQINLAEEVESALLKHTGGLGKLLLLVQRMEENDLDAANALLADMHLSQSDIMQAQLEAMRWANSLQEAADD